MKQTQTIDLMGVKLSLLDAAQLLQAIRKAVEERRRMIVASGNVHAFNLAWDDPDMHAFLHRADLVRLDGVGLRLGAWMAGHQTPPRNTWADFGWDLAACCTDAGSRLFLFGGRQGVARTAAERLREKHPGLQVVGVHHGYINHVPGSEETQKLLRQINQARPDILVVGLGMPLQEQWIMQHADKLDVPVIMTAGGAFDFISGRMKRAPQWMCRRGLEWLFRLIMEPSRMWRRYMIGNPRFIWRVIRWRLFGLPDRVNLRRVRFNTVFPPDARPVIPHTRVMNIPVHLFTTEILHKTLHHLIAQGERAVVANVNMHAMVLARHDSDFERFLHHADYVFCDGAGVMLAALWLNREQIPERITYADWLPALAGFCSDHHLKLFFLGGREGVARRAAEKLVSQYPDLQIAGTHHGFFDKTAASAENEKVLCEINASGAHILVVAFGMPLQEAWLERNWDKLQCHVALTGGAALDYVSGTLRRPPRWMYRHGLEWLGRMAIEPMRLGKRYVQDIVRFFSALLRYKFAGKDKRLGNVRL